MKKRILSLVLALATLLALCACGGGDVGSEGGGALPVEDGFSLYSDEGLGYCFLYPEGRAVGYTEEDGAYIYCGEAGAAPYVLVCRTDGKTTADKYFDSFTDTMLDSFASVASRNIYSVEVDGRELYMTRYVCENGGQRLVIDRYLELRDGFYLQYTSLSEAEKSLDTQAVLQDKLSAHGVDETNLQARQLNVGWKKVYAFAVVNDSTVFRHWFLLQHALHNSGDGYRKFILVLNAKAGGQTALRVCIDKQHTFSHSGQTNAKVDCRSRFTHSTFLVRDGDNLTVTHLVFLPSNSFSRPFQMK